MFCNEKSRYLVFRQFSVRMGNNALACRLKVFKVLIQ